MAHATEIFMWVDERGRVQISDVVPQKYRSSAKKVDSRDFEVSAQERSRAQAQAAQEKLKAAQVESNAAAAQRKAASPNRVAASGASRESKTSSTDCASMQRAYVQSQECFAPYVTANGAVKGEAFQKCTPVLDPSAKCGIQPLE
jgi:hypothetical protein